MKKMCEEFGVNDVGKFKEYEHMAKNSTCYFTKLLKDYSVNDVTVEKSQNTNVLKNLDDLQRKLWNIKSGKLTCKKIKQREMGNFFLFLKFGFWSNIKYNEVSLFVDIFDECMLKKGDNSRNEIMSIEPSSIVSGGSASDFNNNQIEKIEPVKNYCQSKISSKNLWIFYFLSHDKKILFL